ncbi:DgyrCDS14908 [Dimorphilus gyrociliatus]|uniref:DgyrCDS14908 n=1 Tax=Dimorphilus gyrociliatus TaxID=2664684 RepID=A0A7I8WFD4_9ANNE|nr:DgyrCDS14908 [Dimorphilus gyrociliatus]
MAKFCFECRKKINKLKQGTCSHCSHKLHWTCLSDGLCSICSSIQIRSLKIVLRRCDNSCTIKDATKESTIEGNIKEPIKNAVEKDKTLANITVTSMDVDHEQVVSHFSADAIEANELPLKDMNTDEINCAASTMEATLDDERIPTVEDVEDSFESLPEEIDEADGHFKTLNELLEYKTPKKIVLDYERAVWKAALDNWESVTLTGCLFHWNQAVYRKIQELGYSSDFKKKRGQWFEMRQLMALPFLPFHIIPIEFGRIKDYLQSVKKLGLDSGSSVPSTLEATSTLLLLASCVLGDFCHSPGRLLSQFWATSVTALGDFYQFLGDFCPGRLLPWATSVVPVNFLCM